ncbi:MAG: protein-L-isoaspartate(D-aspartate) O-methyltransferase [Acidobacteriota bacterium]|nr:protein-L-isoaspartate(D-aspartate) O-methyltransferase [Acidobacteriota bacterium]
MVEQQLRARDITDEAVLAAMARVPRHLFVPPDLAASAYRDSPLPIGHGQTISQPYMVALMTQLARAAPGKKALDVGTGSGYQAAVLAEIVDQVYTIEILPELAAEARRRLARLGYDKVVVRCGDGYAGWPEHAPFDLIIVAAAPGEVPEPLIEQLAPGGRLLIPVGETHQELVVISKSEDGTISRQAYGGVRFVPMTGEAQRRQE